MTETYKHLTRYYSISVVMTQRSPNLLFKIKRYSQLSKSHSE